MIYVPMLKGRREEFDALKRLRTCLSDRIIPLVEIIKKVEEMQFVVDPQTGEFVWEQHGSVRRRRQEPIREITLENLVEILQGKTAYVDFFRFSEKVYGKRVKLEAVDVAWRVSNNKDAYKEYLRQVKNYSSLIPVISVKKEFEFDENELVQFIRELQRGNESIALRFTEEYMGLCTKYVAPMLRTEDFVLFDIEEQAPETKIMEIEDLMELDTKAQRVLLNSPRKRAIGNKEYPEADLTDLINNGAREIAETSRLDGYGDYCGLKDVLPEKGGNNGTGSALAILYQYEKNAFYAFSNHDMSLGSRGYPEVIRRIREMEDVLNPDSDCLAFAKIDELPGAGNFANWNNITVVRSIHQVYKYF